MKPQPRKLKIQVTVCADAHPELFRELTVVSAEARAERLRTLATAFSLLNVQSAGAQQPGSPATPVPVPTPKTAAQQRMRKAGASMRRVVGSD